MCWPNAGMNCWMMILRHNFTTDLKKWKISVGCFLAGQGQILDGEDGGGGIMSYKYLSPDCSRFGEVSALIAALRSFKIFCQIRGSPQLFIIQVFFLRRTRLVMRRKLEYAVDPVSYLTVFIK